ncbi:hypothetical protein CF327_g4739 [Tilletia walkeri]|nr:hypothetical protein CF327_g4739 [Tilletia walkeri]
MNATIPYPFTQLYIARVDINQPFVLKLNCSWDLLLTAISRPDPTAFEDDVVVKISTLEKPEATLAVLNKQRPVFKLNFILFRDDDVNISSDHPVDLLTYSIANSADLAVAGADVSMTGASMVGARPARANVLRIRRGDSFHYRYIKNRRQERQRSEINVEVKISTKRSKKKFTAVVLNATTRVVHMDLLMLREDEVTLCCDTEVHLIVYSFANAADLNAALGDVSMAAGSIIGARPPAVLRTQRGDKVDYKFYTISKSDGSIIAPETEAHGKKVGGDLNFDFDQLL